MRFNLETIKEYLTQTENEWCNNEDWWGDADHPDGTETIISVNVYAVDKDDVPDWDANCDRYGVTIYEIGMMEDGFYEPETDGAIVGQLYFKHIKSSDGKLFRMSHVIDYEHHVYNNMNPKNPVKFREETYEGN